MLESRLVVTRYRGDIHGPSEAEERIPSRSIKASEGGLRGRSRGGDRAFR